MYKMSVLCFHGKSRVPRSYNRFELLHSHSSFIILYYREYHFKRIQESDSELIREHQWTNGKCKLRKPKARLCILIQILSKYPSPTKVSEDEYKEISQRPFDFVMCSAYTNTTVCWTLVSVLSVFDVNNVSEAGSFFIIRCKKKMIPLI